MRKNIPEPNPGDRFGFLIYIKRDVDAEALIREDYKKRPGKTRTPPKQAMCKCDCGVIKTVDMSALRKGNIRSCGCLRSKDLTGTTINSLFVVGIDTSRHSACGVHKRYLCECKKCGKIKSYRSSDLVSGTAKDCGCGKAQRLSDKLTKDLTGEKFGHLMVLRRDVAIGPMCGRHASWICRCDLCGENESVSSSYLVRGVKDRCRKC